MKHKLLTTQKNSVFERLELAGLNPADFEWVEGIFYTKSEAILTKGNSIKNECPKLILKKHPQYYFQFQSDGGLHRYTCSPGSDHFEEEGFPGVWTAQIFAVDHWANRLVDEIDAPDLWSDLNKYQIAISPDVSDDGLNEVISASEAEVISEKLEFLGDEIKKVYNLASEQDRFVRTKLKYLEDAAKRSRTQDWTAIALTVFQTIMCGLTLTPEQQLQMIATIKSTFSFMNLIG